jgi:hypothetical protein
MNKPKFIFAAAAFSLIFLLGFSISSAQESRKQSEPNYEIVLHTLISSENTIRQNAIPANLSNIIKKLKETFPFSDYQLASTYLERIENKGSFSYSGITNEFTEKDGLPPSFNEWSLRGMSRNPESSKNAITFNAFKFGTRLPVATNLSSDETNKDSRVINYQFVGFTIDNFSISENKPTLLGTLNLPNKNQMAFVVMTIREVE